MEGSVLETIENASVVVIGLSSSYKESQACRTEAEYAYRLKKNIIYIMAEDGYNPKGWLGNMLGNKVWYNPWTNPAGFEADVTEITNQMQKLSSASLPPPAPTISKNLPTSTPISFPSSTDNLFSFAPLESRIINYNSIHVPQNLPVLTTETLKRDNVIKWNTEEVLSWLDSNGLEKLASRFIWHQVKGKSLLALHNAITKGQNAFWTQMIDNLEIPQTGLVLEFTYALNALSDQPTIETKKKEIASWTSDKISSWLESCQFSEAAQQAKKTNLEGRVIVGMYEARGSDFFYNYSKTLGFKGAQDALLFSVELGRLFESY